MKTSDLDACTRERLLAWSVAQAQIDLFVAAGDQLGSRNYWTGANTAHRMMRELENRMKEVGLDMTKPTSARQLEANLAGRYSNGNGNGSS